MTPTWDTKQCFFSLVRMVSKHDISGLGSGTWWEVPGKSLKSFGCSHSSRLSRGAQKILSLGSNYCSRTVEHMFSTKHHNTNMGLHKTTMLKSCPGPASSWYYGEIWNHVWHTLHGWYHVDAGGTLKLTVSYSVTPHFLMEFSWLVISKKNYKTNASTKMIGTFAIWVASYVLCNLACAQDHTLEPPDAQERKWHTRHDNRKARQEGQKTVVKTGRTH